MRAPRFAVIGTGRCGTGYVADLLRRNGLLVGHEWWWHPVPDERSLEGLDGDVSWLALPEVEAGVWAGPVAHVVRNPLGVVRSLMGTRFFHPESRGLPFVEFARASQELPEDPLTACVEWWVQWNARCAAVAEVTLRVEDLDSAWACTELGDVIGSPVAPVPYLSPLTNHKETMPVSSVQIKRLLAGRSAEFGYRL